ncbi:MAG: VTT domain-containing protein [Verrucomicrobia bacterium]|nr:VTT domain-containing protein [Verrucomicrobiota bacterium]
MNNPGQFLTEYAYLVLFALVMADQMGLPLPSFPALLTAGAMAGVGRLDFLSVFLLATAGAFLSDTIWYEIGRYRGRKVLQFVCRMSLEPDICVGQTEDSFRRHGRRTLLVSKFIPWLNVVASPMAGVLGLPRLQFILLNGLGAALWAAALLGLGHLFRTELARAISLVALPGKWLAPIMVGLLVLFVAVKYFRRRHILRLFRMARITPDELQQRMEAGEAMVIVDLRHSRDFERNPQTILGAIRLAPSEIASRHAEIPVDREVILYCTCPNEASSARVALRLKRHGIQRVRPLVGGFEVWSRLGFPLSPVKPAE